MGQISVDASLDQPHVFFFLAKNWSILSNFSCFAMEGIHQSLKHAWRHSRGLSRLRGRLGVQVVVDNHTIDDSLAAHGWDATLGGKKAQHGQGTICVQRYVDPTKDF